jgi:biopolymer transport protein ExbD
MKTRRKDRGLPEINVGSFSDVAFLLIIFFILTTTFVRPAGERLRIPSGTADPAHKDQQKLSVRLSKDNLFYGEKSETMTVDELRAALRREKLPAKPEDQRIVVLESDPDVPYERYFEVVMAITSAGGVLGLVEKDAAKGDV